MEEIPTELNLVNLREITAERTIKTEDPQELFEPLIWKETNVCDHITELNELLQGHSQLRDRITCSPLYPDCLFLCGTNKILEFNREEKKMRVLYDISADTSYNPLSAIKAYKNYIFFGDMQGTTYRLNRETLIISRIDKTTDYEMVNGFSFYEYDGKDYVVVALNSWNLAIKVYEVASLKLVQEIPVPLPTYKTCAGGVSVSPSNRFMVVVGDKREIYVYELVPEGNQCKFQLRKTFGVVGNCHTAHWAPDESCFAVSSEHGLVYLFSFKVTPNNDLDVQFAASYEVNQNLVPKSDDGEPYWGLGTIENVKFHPRPDKKIFAFAGANVGHIYVVDYTTFQIIQTFVLPQEKGKIYKNSGVEFSPDGNNLYVTFSNNELWGVRDVKPLSQLVTLKLKDVRSLAELCLKHIRKNKDNWHPIELQQTLPESLFEKLSL